MQVKDSLEKLLHEQKNFLKEFEETVDEFAASDLVNENINLKKELDEYRSELEELKGKYNSTADENERLKISLKEQILDEKLNILKISREKLETYFKKISDGHTNRLLALEIDIKRRIKEIEDMASKELKNEAEEFVKETKGLYGKLEEKVREKQASIEAEGKRMLGSLADETERLASEEINEEDIQKRVRQNNIEIKIGLNIINKIGILLIIIGVAYAIKHSYTNFFNAYMKGIFAFLVGGILLGSGEWFNRKDREIFAQGLTGGGIAVLYYATFSSYFILKIIDLRWGLILSILITLIALVLSIWYRSKTICAFALIGGFLPFFAYEFSFGLEGTGIYIAMGYLLILNLLTLMISFNMKWDAVNYISFLMNVPTLSYLVFKAGDVNAGIAYSIVTFTMYLIITLAYPLRHKVKLKIPDVVLLALNTSISCVIGYMLFDKARYDSFKGLLAVIFCLVYLGLGQLLEKYMNQEKNTQMLFYLTSFTFAVLIIPFQFGVRWLAMGWLIESVLMIMYGYRYKSNGVETGGWVVFALCLLSFLFGDVNYHTSYANYIKADDYFDIKYFCIISGLVTTLAVYLRGIKNNVLSKYSIKGKFVIMYKYFVLLNFWAYLVYVTQTAYDRFIGININSGFFKTVLFSFVSILLVFAISKIPLICDGVIKGFSIFIYIIADLICLCINTFVPLYSKGGNLEYLALAILFAYNVFLFFNVKDLVIKLIRRDGLNLEVLPLTVSIFLLGNITAILIVQFKLGGINLLFSLLYLVSSFILIIFGFRKKYVLTRRFGLGLAVFSLGKLFLYDLAHLETLYRIIAFFAFGFVMLGISFLYQKIKKSLEVGA